MITRHIAEVSRVSSRPLKVLPDLAINVSMSARVTSPSNVLQGNLYALSLGSSIVITLIGLQFILLGPSTGRFTFGIPIAEHPSSVDKQAANGHFAVIGVRDLTLAFLSWVFTFIRDRRGVGIINCGALFATVGDAIVMANYSKGPFIWILAHSVPAIPLVLVTTVLLRGAPQSKKVA